MSTKNYFLFLIAITILFLNPTLVISEQTTTLRPPMQSNKPIKNFMNNKAGKEERLVEAEIRLREKIGHDFASLITKRKIKKAATLLRKYGDFNVLLDFSKISKNPAYYYYYDTTQFTDWDTFERYGDYPTDYGDKVVEVSPSKVESYIRNGKELYSYINTRFVGGSCVYKVDKIGRRLSPNIILEPPAQFLKTTKYLQKARAQL